MEEDFKDGELMDTAVSRPRPAAGSLEQTPQMKRARPMSTRYVSTYKKHYAVPVQKTMDPNVSFRAQTMPPPIDWLAPTYTILSPLLTGITYTVSSLQPPARYLFGQPSGSFGSTTTGSSAEGLEGGLFVLSPIGL